MKSPGAMIYLASVIALTRLAHGQIFEPQGTHSIENGEGYEKTTQPYVARVPYVLHWHASKTYNLYGKADPTVKFPVGSVGIHVYDESGKIIARVTNGPLDGELQVNRPGTHRVHVYTLGKWETWFVENEAMLQEQHRRMTYGLPAVDPSSRQAPGASVAGCARQLVAEIESGRAKLNRDSPYWVADNAEIDQKIRLVRIAEGKASSVEEFKRLVASMLPAPTENAPPPETATKPPPAQPLPAAPGEPEPIIVE